jgi:hypothetical protein
MAGDVFISYSRRDQEFVLRLVADLEDREAFTWIDRGNIGGGQVWRDAIDAGIRECKVFVLIVSPDSIESPNVRSELELALAYDKPVIPLLYRKSTIPEVLNDRLREYQFLNFNRGAYARNLIDLVEALGEHGVMLQVDQVTLVQRRNERLGAPIDTEWQAAFGRIPGWALAWGVGWAILWTIVSIVRAFYFQPDDLSKWYVPPLGGFIGGAIGGLLAGFFTMMALRHNASSIRWRHMSPAIRIWAIFGSIGVVLAFSIAIATIVAPADQECSDLAECIAKKTATIFITAIVQAFVAVFYAVIALFMIGAAAGWLAVRSIRRLEPGILGRQAIGVLIAWGFGSIVAGIGLAVAAVAIAGPSS